MVPLLDAQLVVLSCRSAKSDPACKRPCCSTAQQLVSLLQHHSVPPGIVLLQADITHPAAQQPAAQPANSHQLHPQLGRQQGEPGSSAAGTMQTAGALAIEPEARRGNFGLGTSRLGLEGMAEAQPVRGAAGMHWLGLESGVGTTTTQPVRASTGALRPEVGPDAGTAGAQPVRASAGDDWLSLESGSGRRQRIRAQISSVAAPVRASWPSAAPAPSTPAVQVSSDPEHLGCVHCVGHVHEASEQTSQQKCGCCTHAAT